MGGGGKGEGDPGKNARRRQGSLVGAWDETFISPCHGSCLPSERNVREPIEWRQTT